jgi:4-amino-4-deoxy-L-arabinose transferase-like glycosyltransferase
MVDRMSARTGSYVLKSESAIILSLFLLTLLLKMPILGMPHYWDSLGRDIFIARWILNNGFSPFPTTTAYNGHPVLFHEVLALFHLLLGTELWVSHIVVVLFSALAVVFTYMTGAHFFGKSTGVAASLLLLFSPMFFAQSGIVQIAAPLASLTIMSVYFAVKDDKTAFAITGSCLAMTKEPAVLVLSMIALYKILNVILKDKKSDRIAIVKESLIYTMPVFVFVAWMLVNKAVYGWFLYPESVSCLSVNPGTIVRNMAIRFSELFLDNYRWVLTLALVSIPFTRKRELGKMENKEEIVLLFCIILISLLFFSSCTASLRRYILFLYPLFFVPTSAALVNFFDDRKISTIVVGALLVLFASGWTGDRTDSCGSILENNMEYLDVIQTHQSASRYIEENFPESTVLTDWPMGLELTFPFLGYVENPVKVISRFVGYELDVNGADIVYYSPQKHAGDMLDVMMADLDMTLLARFEKNGKYTEVYRIEK